MRRSPQAKEYVRSLDQTQASLAPLSDRGATKRAVFDRTKPVCQMIKKP
jgi:hypothetical protein